MCYLPRGVLKGFVCVCESFCTDKSFSAALTASQKIMSASLAVLQDGCRSGNYYSALQSYKTVLNRKTTGPRRNFAEAVEVVKNGVRVGCESACGPVVTDLCEELVSVFSAFDKPFCLETLGELKSVETLLGGQTSGDASWLQVRVACSETFLSWAASAPRSEDLGFADLEYLSVVAASANFSVYKASASTSHLTRAVQLALKTTVNPSLIVSIVAAASSSCLDHEKLELAAFCVATMLSMAESRPSARDKILLATKQVVFNCQGIQQELKAVLRACFAVVDVSADAGKSHSALEKIFASALATKLLTSSLRARLLATLDLFLRR